MARTPETDLERVRRQCAKNLKEFLETDRIIMEDASPLELEDDDLLETQIADLRRRVEILEKKLLPAKKRRPRR